MSVIDGLPRSIATPATALLGIDHPMVLAPMGGVANATLASAVSAAGGLGMIGVGYSEGARLRRELAAADGNRVGCGFITWLLARRPHLLDLALDHDPAAVMLSFGDVSPFAALVKARRIPLICQISTALDAAKALDEGADVLVAQGTEGGGHGMHNRGTMTLVPEVCDIVDQRGQTTPVLAAGGIADGRGLAAAIMLGASGVVLGTRLWASQEAGVSGRAQERAFQSGGDDTLLSTIGDRLHGITWPSGYPSRILRTPFAAEWHGRDADLYRDLGHVADRYQRRGVPEEDFDPAVLTVGEAVGLISRREPAERIVHSIVAEAAGLLAGRRRSR